MQKKIKKLQINIKVNKQTKFYSKNIPKYVMDTQICKYVAE